MLTSPSFRIFFPAALFVLSVVGCSTLPAPSLVPAQVANPEQVEEVQSPTLPLEPAITPLPRIGGSVPVAVDTLSPAAVTTSRVQLRLLLVSPTADDPGLAALEALCDQVGVPCERFVAATTPLTPDTLVAENGEARYQGVFLTNSELAYSSGGAYLTAFDADEWNTLWQFERDYGVRQVSLYSYPGAYPEPLGIGYAGVAPSTTATPYDTTLTAAGREVFSTLKAGVTVPIRHAYTY